MTTENTLSDSALLVNVSRARAEGLGRDVYARLWVTERAESLWDDYVAATYAFDHIELAVRNRFFLERATTFLASAEAPVFVNIAAGLTSYPFLFPEPVVSIEIDLPRVIAVKEAGLADFRRRRLLPDRPVELIAGDVTDAGDRRRLGDLLAERCDGRPSFFLIEGLSYYLDRETFSRLLELVGAVQSVGSLLAFDFWEPRVADHPVFRRFCEFFDRRCGHPQRAYHLMTPDDIAARPGYVVDQLTDVQEQEGVFSSHPVLSCWSEILPERYAVLERAGD